MKKNLLLSLFLITQEIVEAQPRHHLFPEPDSSFYQLDLGTAWMNFAFKPKLPALVAPLTGFPGPLWSFQGQGSIYVLKHWGIFGMLRLSKWYPIESKGFQQALEDEYPGTYVTLFRSTFRDKTYHLFGGITYRKQFKNWSLIPEAGIGFSKLPSYQNAAIIKTQGSQDLLNFWAISHFYQRYTTGFLGIKARIHLLDMMHLVIGTDCFLLFPRTNTFLFRSHDALTNADTFEYISYKKWMGGLALSAGISFD
jgi:hypothetical protein